jgi:hypothetical protein
MPSTKLWYAVRMTTRQLVHAPRGPEAGQVPAIESAQTDPPVGLAQAIVQAAAGKARLRVVTAGMTVSGDLGMQRRVLLHRPSYDDELLTVTVVVQGQ